VRVVLLLRLISRCADLYKLWVFEVVNSSPSNKGDAG